VIVYLVKVVKLLIVALHEISNMIMMNRRGYCLHCTYLVWGESVLDVNEATIEHSKNFSCLSRFNVEVPILWVRTGNVWVRFELIQHLKKTLTTGIALICNKFL